MRSLNIAIGIAAAAMAVTGLISGISNRRIKAKKADGKKHPVETVIKTIVSLPVTVVEWVAAAGSTLSVLAIVGFIVTIPLAMLFPMFKLGLLLLFKVTLLGIMLSSLFRYTETYSNI